MLCPSPLFVTRNLLGMNASNRDMYGRLSDNPMLKNCSLFAVVRLAKVVSTS